MIVYLKGKESSKAIEGVASIEIDLEVMAARIDSSEKSKGAIAQNSTSLSEYESVTTYTDDGIIIDKIDLRDRDEEASETYVPPERLEIDRDKLMTEFLKECSNSKECRNATAYFEVLLKAQAICDKLLISKSRKIGSFNPLHKKSMNDLFEALVFQVDTLGRELNRYTRERVKFHY